MLQHHTSITSLGTPAGLPALLKDSISLAVGPATDTGGAGDGAGAAGRAPVRARFPRSAVHSAAVVRPGVTAGSENEGGAFGFRVHRSRGTAERRRVKRAHGLAIEHKL